MENAEKTGMIHQKKLEKSCQEFRNTRVTSGSQVLVKNGKNVCVAFKQIKKPEDLRAKRSSETTSFAQDMFKPREFLHAGMTKKPLVRYDPNSYRNRLPSPTIVMPYKNSS